MNEQPETRTIEFLRDTSARAFTSDEQRVERALASLRAPRRPRTRWLPLMAAAGILVAAFALGLGPLENRNDARVAEPRIVPDDDLAARTEWLFALDDRALFRRPSAPLHLARPTHTVTRLSGREGARLLMIKHP